MREFFLAFLSSLGIHLALLQTPETRNQSTIELIVWNIGQGQWVSLSTQTECLHFDMGGEHADWKKMQIECGKKLNYAYFSHWDVDHLSFALKASKRLENFCVAAKPRGPCPSEKKRRDFLSLPDCHLKNSFDLEEIFQIPLGAQHLTSNDYSRVFEYQHWAIIQGDSPKREEKIWKRSVTSSSEIKVIVLGHHGSRTSTSSGLLERLPNLKMAIASSRTARYGHPHEEVLKRLKEFGVACLQTEFWGNIHIELPESRNAHP